jgi:hypothetical protein
MFTGAVVWRSIIYTLLMISGKMACGLWLIRFSVSIPMAINSQRLRRFLPTATSHFWGRRTPKADQASQPPAPALELLDCAANTTGSSPEAQSPPTAAIAQPTQTTSSAANTTPTSTDTTNQNISKNTLKPLSLHPAAILGCAMVSRGEIGFLISSLADSNEIFSSGGNDDIFLIVTWAIVLCTVVGPVGVGLLVKRLKRLEMARDAGGGGRDVLGVWGVR